MKLSACGFILVAVSIITAPAQNSQTRWEIRPDGSIQWNIRADDPHGDHIEMSGEQVSYWVGYSVDSLMRSEIRRTVIFPSFRMKPNDTHGTLMVTLKDDDLPRFFIDMKPVRPALLHGYLNPGVLRQTLSVNHSGVMEVRTGLESGARGQTAAKVEMRHSLYPSVDRPAVFERYVFLNRGDRSVTITMEYLRKEIRIDTLHSTGGPHSIWTYTVDDGARRLAPGDSAVFAVVCQAVRYGQPLVCPDPATELLKRRERLQDIRRPMRLITPDPVLNTAFEFAKQRVGESIYKTLNGYINSPGGFRYHAAIWANDQAEYTGPWFGYAGYPLGREAALNAYRWFAKFMNADFKPIPSSIIAEGTDYWDGAGDRGDQAMIAYGASRFALASGDIEIARELWPLIEYCLEFSRRKVNRDGVVESDSDELEGRFPAGKANLCTSSLYYDALLSAAVLAGELGLPQETAGTYRKQAVQMRNAIGAYFGATVEGFDTYRYYDGNDILRSWICMPLTVGIFDRRKGTVDALFSPRLWTPDGLATQAGDKTFWDRSTLYGLRGVFAAGETEKALEYLRKYSERRLLGNHVPYPVEAWPEGDQKHLSGESALYCRVITEGMFGLRPSGLNAFTLDPRLPDGWNEMALKDIRAFGEQFDLTVSRQGKQLRILVGRVGKKPVSILWDGRKPAEIKLDKPGAAEVVHKLLPVSTDGKRFVDSAGRQVMLNGINYVNKNPQDNYLFRDAPEVFSLLRDKGVNCIRLGIIWDGVEPEPGRYDDHYLDQVEAMVDLAAENGLYVMLDMHQDLYGVSMGEGNFLSGDGAPEWATLTDGQPHVRGAIWSDSYFISPAVQRSFDHFWANRPAADGIGIQDHYARMWQAVAGRFAGNPAVIGYDLMNEPFNGTPGTLILPVILEEYARMHAEETGRVLSGEELLALWSDEASRAEALARLTSKEKYARVISAATAASQAFEMNELAAMYQRVANAIREADTTHILFLEHAYFSNAGVASGLTPPVLRNGQPDTRIAYAAHGYDLLVDSRYYDSQSNDRVEWIFSQIDKTSERLNIPVLVGEWGAFGGTSDGITASADFIRNLFDRLGFSHAYWAYHQDVDRMPFFGRIFDRPVVYTTAGKLDSVGWDRRTGNFSLAWNGNPDAGGPTVVWVPDLTAVKKPAASGGNTIRMVPAGSGRGGYLVVPAEGRSGRQALNFILKTVN